MFVVFQVSVHMKLVKMEKTNKLPVNKPVAMLITQIDFLLKVFSALINTYIKLHVKCIITNYVFQILSSCVSKPVFGIFAII